MNIDTYQESANLLQVLGLPKGTSWDKVQEAYQDLMVVWNPERFNHDSGMKQRVRQKTSEIKFAYAKLEEMRAAYDRLQMLSVLAAESAQSADSGNAATDTNKREHGIEDAAAIAESSRNRRESLARRLFWLKPLLFLCTLPFYIIGGCVRITSLLLDFLYSTTLFQASLRVAVAALLVFCIFPKTKNLSFQELLVGQTPSSLLTRYEGYTSSVLNEAPQPFVPSPAYYASFERSGGSIWNSLSGIFGDSSAKKSEGKVYAPLRAGQQFRPI